MSDRYQLIMDFFSSREHNILRANGIYLYTNKVIKCTRAKLFSRGKFINAGLSRKLILLEEKGEIEFRDIKFFREPTRWLGLGNDPIGYTIYPIGYNEDCYLTRLNWDMMYPKLLLKNPI